MPPFGRCSLPARLCAANGDGNGGFIPPHGGVKPPLRPFGGVSPPGPRQNVLFCQETI